MIDVWMNALLKPKETFASEKSKADLGKGIINFVIAGLISGVIGFVATTFALGGSNGATGAVMGAAVGALGIVVSPIVMVIGSLIGAGVVYLFAKLLGGKGTYTQLFYLTSLYAVPIAVLGIIGIIPIIGLIGILVMLYTVYLEILAIAESQGLSLGRAFLSILIPVVIISIIVAILVVVVGVAILGALGPQLQQTGLFGLGA
ncbi:MAG: YIP1 family protein [Candidatus Diapherotrites archaeon]|nr:YIP1 family protein [Candidatus Diapherotrites archaeon]